MKHALAPAARNNRRLLLIAAVGWMTLTMPTRGQDGATAPQDAAAKAPAYDVVSVRPNKSVDGGSSWRTMPDGFVATNCTLKSLVWSAYGLLMYGQVSGWPKWVDSSRFDVEAKMDEEAVAAFEKLPRERRTSDENSMLRSLLADRFQLKVHYETKEMPVFALVVAKGGAKLKEADAHEANAGSMTMRWGELTAQAMTVSRLADSIAGTVGRVVIDRTGLPGKYDITLKWAPDTDRTPQNDSEPSLLTALQEQLGLKLESQKAPLQVLVIDRVEQPSEN